MYLDSSNIYIFPSSINRPNTFPNSRGLSEDNLTTVIRSAGASKGSFILSEKFDSKGIFEFFIHGYYVRLEGTEASPISFDQSNGAQEIYAVIYVDKSVENFPTLYGEDTTNNVFTAVEFVTAPPTETSVIHAGIPCDVYYLRILKLVGESFVVPSSSLKTIDGGLIE